jgi:hypothetical protein
MLVKGSIIFEPSYALVFMRSLHFLLNLSILFESLGCMGISSYEKSLYVNSWSWTLDLMTYEVESFKIDDERYITPMLLLQNHLSTNCL